MRTLCVLVILALTMTSCAAISGSASGLRPSTPRPRLSPTEPPAYLLPPQACTVALPPLTTWPSDPDSDAVSLHMRCALSDDPAAWVVPFHGLLLSPEARARAVQRRGEQASRVDAALRLRRVACQQWLGRVDLLVRERDWLEVEVEALRTERALARWLLVGAGGVLALVAVVAVAGD